MGRIKTKHVKSMAKEFMRSYPERFSKEFGENKKTLEASELKSKWLLNRVAGALVRLKKQEGRRVTAPVKVEKDEDE